MTVKDRNWFIFLDSTMYYMLVSSKVSWQHSWRTGLSYQGCCTLGLDEAEGLRVGWVHAAELEGVGRGRWQGTPVRTRACLWAQCLLSRPWETAWRQGAGTVLTSKRSKTKEHCTADYVASLQSPMTRLGERMVHKIQSYFANLFDFTLSFFKRKKKTTTNVMCP